MEDTVYVTDAECAEKFKVHNRTIPKDFCSASSDNLLCWPPTSSSTIVTQACFSELNNILYDTRKTATRYCDKNGLWNKTNYTTCTELELEVNDTVRIISVIYYSGYSASLVALTMAVFVFLCFRELRISLKNRIHINLMITYVLHGITWISTLALNLSHHTQAKGLCFGMMVTLQYFSLTNFFWMFIEGYYLYQIVANTFKIQQTRMRTYYLIGYFCPIPILVVWILVRFYFPVITEDRTYRILAAHCVWMTPQPADWIHKFPVLVILILNCVILYLVLNVLMVKLEATYPQEIKKYRKVSRALLFLVPLLGVTYILTLILPSDGPTSNYLVYLRDVLIASQGSMVALFYCFLNGEVHKVIKNRYRIHRDRQNIDLGRRRLTNTSNRDGSETIRMGFLRLHLPIFGRRTTLTTDVAAEERNTFMEAPQQNAEIENCVIDVEPTAESGERQIGIIQATEQVANNGEIGDQHMDETAL